MMRWIVALSVAFMVSDEAGAADQIAVPRPGAYADRPLHPAPRYERRRRIAEQEAEPLISSPSTIPTTPLLPGSSTLPGYYGRPFNYYYQGPYYGGEYTSYFVRLPYACGVTGYC